MNKEDKRKELELLVKRRELLEVEAKILEIESEMTIAKESYKGNRSLYNEGEEDFDIRVQNALQDLVKYNKPLHAMILQYYAFILKITDSFEEDNPILVDIEAFEDLIEPMVMVIVQRDSENNNIKLSELFDYAKEVVVELLMSDFFSSPYTKENGGRFVIVTPEFNYAVEHLLNIPEEYKIQTDICVSDQLVFGGAELIIDEGKTPVIRIKIEDTEDVTQDNPILNSVDVSCDKMAQMYLKTEIEPDQFRDYRITDDITELLAMNLLKALGEVKREEN